MNQLLLVKGGSHFDHFDIELVHITDAIYFCIGPYLASLNLDKLILDSEKENKPEDKISSKFGMDSTERPGADGGNRNAGIRSVYNYYFLFLCSVLSLA